MNKTDEQEERLRQTYRDQGWGRLAEAIGFDPVHTEAAARQVFKAWADERKAMLIEMRMLSEDAVNAYERMRDGVTS